MRRIALVNDEYYHIFNRGVEKRKVFSNHADHLRFIDSILDFNSKVPSWRIKDLKSSNPSLIEVEPRLEDQLVEIVAYCLNPNHFHLIVKQKKDNGISEFMRKVGTGYTMYFNKKYKRSGVLFQGRFKSVLITSNEQLIYTSAYVNCNCEIHNIAPVKNYPWSSFGEYLGLNNNIVCQKESVLGQFRNANEYKKYALNQIERIKENKKISKKELELE